MDRVFIYKTYFTTILNIKLGKEVGTMQEIVNHYAWLAYLEDLMS